MWYVIIGMCIVTVISICIVFVRKTKKNKDIFNKSINKTSSDKLDSELMQVREEPQELLIKMDVIPAEDITDENKLMEITDSKVLARINSLVPGLAQTGNAVNNAVQAAKTNGEVLYRATIPAGAKLADSKEMKGAVRGLYHGADGIEGHANLMAVETQNGAAIRTNTAAATMGVASMVVGQYYMTQINAELGKISDGISKISDFQNNEYGSRVFSLVANVKNIADFQVEILENNELRLSKILRLDNLEGECTQLLVQANLTLDGYSENKNLDYETYEKELKEAHNWYMYQKILLNVLYKISDLRYSLHFGCVSREQCEENLTTCIKQVKDTQIRLTNWHQDTINRLNIDTTNYRRKREGFDGIIHLLPGLFNDDFNFRTIAKSTTNMIKTQASQYKEAHQQDTIDLYAEDVQLIAKEGKIYYLPNNKG